jgi:hypothetical protein
MDVASVRYGREGRDYLECMVPYTGHLALAKKMICINEDPLNAPFQKFVERTYLHVKKLYNPIFG